MVEPGSRPTTLVMALLRRHANVQYIRLRSFPTQRKDQRSSNQTTLDRALRHERGPEFLWEVPPDLAAVNLMNQLTQISPNRDMVGLCSRMELRNGTSKHALLMDFRCKRSPASLRDLQDACSRIGYSGWLLESHESYHFYGDDLVDEVEWLGFMGRWLLLEHFSDVRFIGHCVIERVSCLRLTGDEVWSEPRVAARVLASAEEDSGGL
jgi:hypothetical protein